MSHTFSKVLMASGLLTLVAVGSASAAPATQPSTMRAFAALSTQQRATVQPLSDAALASVRGAGWADAIAAAIAACGSGCTSNVQSVNQTNTDPNGSNTSVINQSNR